ncbi:hypothetical protein GBAR_LOCUS5342 [Geodia barretti]|nr:hypothetical protein GBAR_LOCUS5342 [Geodia barretti]
MALSRSGLFFLLFGALCSAQEIVHGPQNITVFLDLAGSLLCETKGGTYTWVINGTLPSNIPFDILSDMVLSDNYTITNSGSRINNLTIRAKDGYSGTRFQCRVVNPPNPPALSESAFLKIQGLLSAPLNLRETSNASSVTISWSAPFSLDVTGVDSDIWYSVLIYNVTDENNPTAILCTDCINITETHYTFSPDYLSPRHVYNFSVIPLNGAGQGESSPSITITIGPPSAVGGLSAVSNASSVTISWSAPFSLDVTGVDPDIWYSVLIYNVTDENNPKLFEKHTITTSYTFAPAGFSPCHKYLFSVIALNGAGRGESCPNITTGTQHCDLSTVINPSSTVKHPETTVPTGGEGLSPKDSKSLAGLAIGLAVVGAVVAVVGFTVMVFIIILILRRRRKHPVFDVEPMRLSELEAKQHEEEESEARMEEDAAVVPQTTPKHTASTQSSQPKHKKEKVDDEKRHLLSNSVSASADTSTACDTRWENGPENDAGGSLALTSTAKITTRYQLQGRGNAPNSDIPAVTPDKGVPESKEQGEEATRVVVTSSGVPPSMPEDSRVQYQEIDIRATQKMLRPTPSGKDSGAKDATIKPGGQDPDVDQGASNKGVFEQTPEESTHSQDNVSIVVVSFTPSQKTDSQDNSTRGSKVTISNEHRESIESDAPPLVKDFPSECLNSEDGSSKVYEDNTEIEEEAKNHGLFSSVECTDKQSKSAKVALGEKDCDLSALSGAERSPTFPPLACLTDPAILTGGDGKALELSAPTLTDGTQVTEGERKVLKVGQKTRGSSTSRKSHRKKKKKRGSPSPPTNEHGPGHECEAHDHSHPRTKTRKSCGNLPQD